ncbi:putative late blight resistance protein homolog R1A-3 [Lycium barbarum]|uniref:putative late blight resistance protein homolog R1A-3 n=1 Tax=Lycium barbarum TaxID=112863 RepID=UPI00293E8250|nr:putative late blight resistance protein homolog R1A-3 [Lycium barbarum]
MELNIYTYQESNIYTYLYDIHTYLYELFNFIENQVVKCGAGTDHRGKLKEELAYLLSLVDRSLSGWRVDEDNDLNALVNRIKILITKARQDLDLLCDIGSSKLDDAICDILEEIWLLKPDMILFLRLLANHPSGVVYLDDIVGGCIESLVDSLVFLLNNKADFVAPFKEDVEVLKGNLICLKGFVSFILENSNHRSGDFSNFLNHVTAVTKKAASCTSYLLCLARKSDDCIGFMPVDLLHSTKPAKSDVTCFYVGGLKLLPSRIMFTRKLDVFAADFVKFMLLAPMTKLYSSSYILVYKDRVQNLQLWLRSLLLHILCHNIHNESLVIFDLVVNEFWSFIYSLDNREMNEDLGNEFDLAISQLVQKMKPLASKILEGAIKIQKPIQLLFSQIDSIGCIDLVSQNLQRLLDNRNDLISPVTHQIEFVMAEIKIFKPFLEANVDQQGELCTEMLDACKHLTGLFANFEYLVDKFLVDPSPRWEDQLGDVVQNIKFFKEIVEFEYICKEEKDVRSDCQTSKPSTPIIDEAVVGLEDQIEILMARLTGGEDNRKIIPIIGMPGIGKTTLAKRIYNDRRTSDHFDIHAWCSVSPRHTASELVQDILISIVDLNDDIYKSKELNSPELVHRRLFERRYLIVLDDMWNSQRLDELQRCFPDNQNGSRILVTCGRKCEGPYFDEPLSVRLLTREESWDLLQVKYNHLRFCNQGGCLKPPIPNEKCPDNVGMEIAVKCGGLPLAIVLVAGFLVNTEDDKDWLTITTQAFTSKTYSAEGDCNEIIKLSYKNMPAYLRQCFLYFAAFPVSTEVPVSKLKWLWVSEGFVKKDEMKKPEEVAEDYLNDLMGRSLVMEAKRSSNGKLKSCRVHDCLYHFCGSRSRGEHFLPVTWRVFEERGHRMGFFVDDLSRHFRTVIYSSEYGSWLSHPSECILFRIGQLVRVLDLGCIDIGGSFPLEIEKLVHLRFLSLKGGMIVIPSWIAKLWNLETFLVKGKEGEIALPDTLFSMMRLRHVHVDNCTFSDSDLPQLECLQTLSTPSLSYETGNKMRSFLFLQKLRCTFLESWGHSEKSGGSCNRFPVFEFLNQLESLNVIYQGRVLQPCEFNFPSNLKKLTLSKFRLPWVEISAIAALQNLEVLKLLLEAFEGEEWNVSDEEFPKLKFLKLGNLNITRWNISEDAFPCLEQVVLQKCKQLIEIPSVFGDCCYSLQKIEVFICGAAVSQSAREIEEIRHEDYADANFKVTIQNPNMD